MLWNISTSWRSSIESALKPLDLTHPQFVVLATLGWLTRNGDLITQKELSTTTGLDPNTLSQVLKGLEKKQLIIRTPSTDSRAKNPQLTSAGLNKIKIAIPVVEKQDALFFKKLSESEKTDTIKTFHKLSN